MRIIFLLLILTANISKGNFRNCDSTTHVKHYTLMLVQLDSIQRNDKNDGYILNFKPLGTYGTFYLKHLILIDSTGKLDTLKGESKYHSKLCTNGFNSAHMEYLSEGKAKSFNCFLKGYVKVKRRSIKRFKANQMFFLNINHDLSTDKDLVINFMVKAEEIDISQLTLID